MVNEIDIIVQSVVLSISAIFLILTGYLLSWFFSNKRLSAAKQSAKEVMDMAKRDAETRKKEIELSGKDLIIINPICPHTLTNRPIIFSEDSILKITLWSKDEGAILTLDGQEAYKIVSGNVVTVKRSRHATMLVLSPYRSYGEILRSKLGWGDLPPGARKKKNA